ncbi:MAG: hypothetical protein KJ072_27625 [Verrucomicrobia bacterium]|nr:hypothetical protein [Verrucomicrobiota bacterium]
MRTGVEQERFLRSAVKRRLIWVAMVAVVMFVVVANWPRAPRSTLPGEVERTGTSLVGVTGMVVLREEVQGRPAMRESPVLAEAGSVREWIREWQDRSSTLPRSQAAAELSELLRSGRDGPTGLEFRVGPGGFLQAAPTLRVWLLDELGRVDPAMAVVEARAVLARSESPDEWAVALRICATADGTAAGQAWVREQARELIRREAWLESPSIGLLEAFDLFVYTRDVEAVPELAALVRRKENRAVAHAAYVAVDRMLLVSPEPVLEMLIAEPALLEGRETTRGNYVARADVSDPGQRRLVEEYLLDPRRSWEELEAFAGVFPNANLMVSHNLLTSVPAWSGAELRRRDLAAAEVVGKWAADRRFERLWPLLGPLERRLDDFVRQHLSAP